MTSVLERLLCDSNRNHQYSDVQTYELYQGYIVLNG